MKKTLFILAIGFTFASCHKKDCEAAMTKTDNKYHYYQQAITKAYLEPSQQNTNKEVLAKQNYEQAKLSQERTCKKCKTCK